LYENNLDACDIKLLAVPVFDFSVKSGSQKFYLYLILEMLNIDTKLYIIDYTKPEKPKIVNIISSPQTDEHN
jgi:hypothetical protein